MENFCPLYLASTQHPLQIAFRCGESEVSFARANLLVGGLAQKLSLMKLGSRVSVVSRNSIEMVLLVFALQRLGVSVVLHNTRLKTQDWKEQADLAGVSLGFVAGEFLAQAPFEHVLPLPELSDEAEFVAGVQLSKEAVVIFTSGSTGSGKGVQLSLGNLLANARASNQVNDLTIGDCWLASLPFFHVGGLCIVFRTVLAGACSLIANSQSGYEVYRQLEEVSHLSLVPSVLAEILNFNDGYFKLSKLKNILLGGAPSEVKLLKRILELPVRTSYGMTETSSHICMSERKAVYDIEDLTTSGFALQDVEIKIAQDGEICLRGPSVFLGYLGRPKLEMGEWFNTGDLGSLDSRGRLRIEGRKDRTIISGGENINPKQIEDLALTSAGISEAVVVGVRDLKWGNRPVLYVVVNQEFSESDLTKLLENKLPKFKIPDRIIVLDALPKTAIGKIDYQKLADLQ